MTATKDQRAWSIDQHGREHGYAPGVEQRMAGQAKYGQRTRNADSRRAVRNPVSVPQDIKGVVDRHGTVTPIIDRQFYAETMAAVSIHLARGHFAQAVKTIEAAEASYQLLKIQNQADASGITEKSAWHVSQVFDMRTAAALERCCNGTLGAVLEVFPGRLLDVPGIGPQKIEQIAKMLVRHGLLTADEAASRVRAWGEAMLTGGAATGTWHRIREVVSRFPAE